MYAFHPTAPAAQPPMPTLAATEIRAGDEDCVVCLHSSTGSQSQWKLLLQALAGRHSVRAVDLLGHGRSPAWPEEAPNALDTEAAAVAAGLHTDTGLHLVGHSYGAAVALRLALRRPQQVKSLTLYEPVLFGLLDRHDPARHEIEDIARSVAALVKAGALADAARVFVGYWGGPKAWGSMNEAQQAAVLHRIVTVPRHFEALLSLRWGARHFARLQMPVLLLQGEATRAPARRVTERLLQVLPQARGEVFAGAAHLGPVTHAQPVLQSMLAHLQPLLAPARQLCDESLAAPFWR